MDCSGKARGTGRVLGMHKPMSSSQLRHFREKDDTMLVTTGG